MNVIRKITNFKKYHLSGIRQNIRRYGFKKTLALYSYDISVSYQKKKGLHQDAIRDKRICGIDMTKYIPAIDREGRGTTGTESIPYCFLEIIYDGAEFSKEDVLIDVGCGYGRVLAYLLDNDFPGKLVGVELNPKVVVPCKSWTDRYDNIEVIEGNAFDLNYDAYTVLNMSRPMIPGFFEKFIDKVEKEVTHPIRLFYGWDGETGNYMDNRLGWKLLRREVVWKVNGIPVAKYPQRFSVWLYIPETFVDSCIG